MRQLRLAALFLLCPLLANAAEPISDRDVGTYEITRADGQSTAMQMRLSKAGGGWLMEGRKGEEPWKDISCGEACALRTSADAETAAFLAAFPAGMQQDMDIACIQNTASAFCRLTRKSDPKKAWYAMVALVTGKPIPVPLRRLRPAA